MKTNLTTKQIKKIRNGKLAIFKDIDTADAREYLLKVLDWLFPNDKDANKQRAVEIGLYFYDFGDETWCYNEKVELKTINLSKIMYTYNPKQFKPTSMPCTEEQWNNDLKPVVEAFGIEIGTTSDFDEYWNITNFYDAPNVIGTINDTLTVWGEINNHLKSYSPSEFLEACGIVRVDKEQETVITFTNMEKPATLGYIITEDQIKTARTNPETLEELFPKVFEKPVVEVGKWNKVTHKGNKVDAFIFLDSNGITYGFGFDHEKSWLKPKQRENEYNDSRYAVSKATLSDLQPLFEAEFNKRYKDGDLLECAHDKNDTDILNRAEGVLDFYFDKDGLRAYINGIQLFGKGNFAKVIKSAELIKAEEELEEAKNKVERLTNK